MRVAYPDRVELGTWLEDGIGEQGFIVFNPYQGDEEMACRQEK